jgi:hypothetical protein
MLPIKLFWFVFCLFWFNRNIETLCFGKETKKPNKLFRKKNEIKLKKTEKPEKTKKLKNRKNHKFSVKNSKICSLSNCFGLFSVCLVQSKHRNSLFLYGNEKTETNVLFRIVPKLVSVPVSVVSNRN